MHQGMGVQALAVLGWGLWLSWLAGRPACPQQGAGRSALLALSGVLLIQAVMALWAGTFSPVPLGLGLMGGGMALAAALAAWSAASPAASAALAAWSAACSVTVDGASAAACWASFAAC